MVRNMSGRCLNYVWKVSELCLEGVWKVSGGVVSTRFLMILLESFLVKVIKKCDKIGNT